MSPALEQDAVAAAPSEAQALRQLADLVRHDKLQTAALVGSDDQRRPLPQSVRNLLARLIRDLADGRAVTIVARARDLTTNEAAELLNVSRPYVIKLLDSKVLPCHRVGTHRRIPAEAVLAYRARQRAEQAAILAELTQEAQDLGFYD